MSKEVKKRKKYWKIILVVLIVLGLIFLFVKTGFMQLSKIDERDLEHWEYEDGLIKGAEEFSIEGESDGCWVLIHSYASTPATMERLAEEITIEFGDSVRAVRLKGHGEVPSNILNLTLDDWYEQVSEVVDEEIAICGDVNVVGSSFGGALTIRLAEEKDLNNVYLLNAYIYPTYNWYHIINPNYYLWTFGDVLHYYKKNGKEGINDPVGSEGYIGYLNFIFRPVKDSKGFLEENIARLDEIDENILILHSWEDSIADSDGAVEVYEKASSEVKELKMFEDSDHLLLADYDKEEVMQMILDFERAHR